VPCQEGGILPCLFERTHFHAGDTMPRARLAVGYAF
jgi:hypothetical protein